MNDNAREEIARIVFEGYTGLPWEDHDDWMPGMKKGAYKHADAILTKLRSLGYVHLDDEIGGEVVEQCGYPSCMVYPINCKNKNNCDEGTGKFTRPRTIRDAIGGK